LAAPEKQTTIAPLAEPEPVAWVPSAYFFCQCVESAPAMRANEVPGFAELTLEGIAPFDLDQLNWGYLHDPQTRKLLLYAAVTDRLTVSGIEREWAQAGHALPAFLAACGERGEQARCRFLDDGGGVAALLIEEGERLPARILYQRYESADPPAGADAAGPGEAADAAAPSPEGESTAWPDGSGTCPPEAFEARQALIARVDAASYPPEEGLLRIAETSFHGEGELRVKLVREYREAPVEPLPEARIAGPDALWEADVRDPDFLARERRNRRLGGRLWKGFKLAAAAAVLLLLFEVGQGVAGLILSNREELRAAQAPLVAEVVRNQEQIGRLAQFSGDAFQPLRMLDLVNLVRLELLEAIAPDDLVFRSAQIEAENRVTVNGQAGAIPQVNAFQQRLEDSGLFARVDIMDNQFRQQQAVFTLDLIFKPGAVESVSAAPADALALGEGTDAQARDTEETP